MGCSQNGFRRDIYSNKTLPQETRKSPILHLKQLEEEEQMKSKVSRRKEIRKMRAEIEMKKTVEKTNEPKSWFSLKR